MSVQPYASMSRTVPIVFIVDGDASGREALELLVRRPGWQPLAFASAEEFLGQPRVAAPCCLVLDVALPDLNGLDLQQRVSDRNDMPVIFVTRETDVQTTVRAMKAGALEFFTKPFRSDVLLRAISFALERSQAVLRSEAATRTLRESYASLSHREREVMELVVSGWLNKQVGAALGLSEVTVKAHRGKMMRKMNAVSLPDLVKMAATLGLTVVPRASGPFSGSFAAYAAVRNHSLLTSCAGASANA